VLNITKNMMIKEDNMKIKNIKIINYSGKIYNIETEKNHNYFVGISSVLVHNCYKSNTGKGENMSFDTFKTIIDKMPTLTQIAFGIGDLTANPDLFRMFKYCRGKRIVPNLTINGIGLTDSLAEKLVYYLGACAISHYNDDTCYNAVKLLTDKGLKQANIHQLLAQETKNQIWKLIDDIQHDSRLKKLNAVVFLSLKQKGRGTGYHQIFNEDFQEIVDFCMTNGLKIGFDSCTSCKFVNAIRDYPNREDIEKYVEPCESGLFSFFIDVNGFGYPCSFSPNTDNWHLGIDIKNTNDFLSEVWFSDKIKKWRKDLLNNKRNCPIYDI
jgi:MoaA/NifB/PqqE/SkfB family radical SAM enzyme